MRILVVDDWDHRHDELRKCYNSANNILIHSYGYDEALIEINATPYLFDAMFLDHDLSDEAVMCDPDNTYEKTGTDIAKHIINTIDTKKLKKNLKIVCHSMNPKGRDKMTKLLKKAGFNATDFAFDKLMHCGNVLDKL